MTGSHIPAVSALRPVLSHTSSGSSQQGARAPALGEFLKLTLDTPEGGLHATSHSGTSVKLPPGTLQGELSPGDVLLVKVVATTPQLELARIGHAAPLSTDRLETRASPPDQAAAMRPDQTAMLRMAWAPPDAATLAAGWRVLVLEHLRQIDTPRPTVLNSDWAASHALLLALEHGHGGGSSAAHWSPIDRWLFPVHAWAGLPFTLQLLPPRGRTHEGKTRRPPHGWGLRVHGVLPGLGHIEIRVQLSTEGASVLILADNEQALQHVREAQGEIGRAVNRAGWRLRACQLLRSLAPEPKLDTPDTDTAPLSQSHASPSTASAGLPQGLFRVATEVLLTLGALGVQGRISPAFR